MAIRFLDEEQQNNKVKEQDAQSIDLETISVKRNKPSIKFLDKEPEIKHSTSSILFGKDRMITDAIVEPLVSVSRGFHTGTANFYGMLDTVANLPDLLSGQDRTVNIFRKWQEQMEETARSIPESRVSPLSNIIFETAGSALPTLTSFASVPGGDVAKFAVTKAIDEYQETGSPVGLITGGIKGAIEGKLIPVVVNAGINLMKNVGKGAAKAYIKFITKSEEIADDFVNSVGKYNVSPFKKIKSLEQTKADNHIRLKELNQNIKSDISVVKTKNLRQEQILDAQMKESLVAHKEANIALKQGVATRNAATIEAATNKSMAAIKNSTSVLNTKATVSMDGALSEYKVVKKRLGENVGNAIKEASNKAPGSTISHSTVMNKVNKTLEQSPFKSTSGYFKPKEFKPNTSISADNTDVTGLNNLMKELSAYKNDGFPIKYLQDLKNAARDQAGKAYKAGNNQLGKMYSDLAKDVNPATIIESSKSLSSKFPNIAEANKQFSSMIKKYDTAMDMYFTKNALGEYVPDVNKALNKIASGDAVAVRQMKLADRALPENLRIFPKVQGLLNETEKVAVANKATIKSLKNRIKAEQSALDKASRKSQNALTNKQLKIKQERKIALGENIKTQTKMKNDVLNTVEKQLTKEEKFLHELETLRNFTPPNGGLANMLQRVLGYGSILPVLTGSPVGSAVGAAGFFALSPKLTTPIIKGAINTGRSADRIISPLIKNKSLQKIIINKSREEE